MADTIIDNSLATTQRLIQASSGRLTFGNTPTDNSFSIGPGDSNDYYKLTVSRSSNVIVKLNPQGGDLGLELLDSNGVPVVGSSTNNTNSLADAVVTDSILPLQTGQTYYIRVFGSSATDINYGLTVETNPTSRADLVWRNYSVGANGVWRMNNAQIVDTQRAGPTVDPSWNLGAVADFDRDGIEDYIWHQPSSGALGIWLMNSDNDGIRSIVNLPSVAGDWYIGGVGDFGGDSSLDIVWCYSPSGYAGVWLMDGTNFSQATSIEGISDPNWIVETVADFNGDSEADIFYRNYATGENLLWMMQNTQFKSSLSLPSQPLGFAMHGTGDFNGDGSADLIWRDYRQGNNSIWYMNQTQFASSATLPSIDPSSWLIAGVIRSTQPGDLAGNSPTSAFAIGKLDTTAAYSDALGPADPQEYYAFTLDIASEVSVTVDGLGISAATSIDILATDGVTVKGSTAANGADKEELSKLLLDPGTYYVRMATTSATTLNYTITLLGEERSPVNLLFPTLTAPETVTVFRDATTGAVLPQPVSVRNPFTFDLEYKVTYVGRPLNEFKVGFYLSKDADLVNTDGSPDTDNLRLDLNGDGQITAADVDVIQNRQPGTVITETQRLTLPNKDNPFWIDNGQYHIIIVLDPDNEIVERDQAGALQESDNTFAAPITIRDAKAPDLEPQNFSVTESANRGNPINLSGIVRNIGNARSDLGITANSPFSVSFYLSKDNQLNLSGPIADRDFALGSAIQLSPLAANDNSPGGNDEASISGTLPFLTRTLPQNWVGYSPQQLTYYVLMVVDPSDALDEITDGRANNLAFDTITIT